MTRINAALAGIRAAQAQAPQQIDIDAAIDVLKQSKQLQQQKRKIDLAETGLQATLLQEGLTLKDGKVVPAPRNVLEDIATGKAQAAAKARLVGGEALEEAAAQKRLEELKAIRDVMASRGDPDVETGIRAPDLVTPEKKSRTLEAVTPEEAARIEAERPTEDRLAEAFKGLESGSLADRTAAAVQLSQLSDEDLQKISESPLLSGMFQERLAPTTEQRATQAGLEKTQALTEQTKAQTAHIQSQALIAPRLQELELERQELINRGAELDVQLKELEIKNLQAASARAASDPLIDITDPATQAQLQTSLSSASTKLAEKGIDLDDLDNTDEFLKTILGESLEPRGEAGALLDYVEEFIIANENLVSQKVLGVTLKSQIQRPVLQGLEDLENQGLGGLIGFSNIETAIARGNLEAINQVIRGLVNEKITPPEAVKRLRKEREAELAPKR